MLNSVPAIRGDTLGAYLTSKFTTAPARTFCPAGGVWATMMLAGDTCDGTRGDPGELADGASADGVGVEVLGAGRSLRRGCHGHVA